MARSKDEVSIDTMLEYNIQLKHRVITLVGAIDEEAVKTLDYALCEFSNKDADKPVHLHICSHGGDVYCALAMLGLMKAAGCDIHTYGFGEIASAATIILAAGDRRFVSNYAHFMHHEGSYDIDGRHSQIKAAVKQHEREEQQWATLMEKFTKKPKQFWLKEGMGVDVYFTPHQLVELGVADEVI